MMGQHSVIQVTLRFYAELNDFLPPVRRFRDFSFLTPQHNTVKHLIESLGIPHTEIDLILVNGRSVKFSFIPKNGDQISIYPVFESFDINPANHLRPQPLRQTNFIADTHLGKLSGYLRMLGFDTLYNRNFQDEEIVQLSLQEQRIILTRDRGLLMRNAVTHGIYVHTTQPREQLSEIMQRLQLKDSIQPFRRCLECNTLLEKVEKRQIISCLPPQTSEMYNDFQQCPGCKRIYWQGTHFQRMKDFIEEFVT